MAEKRKLVVFSGKPGAGKSTLIKKYFGQYKVVDVMPFVKARGKNGKFVEETTILGYEDMYDFLSKLSDPVVILEIGTNHPGLNASELERMTAQYEVTLFLCEIDPETAHARVKERSLTEAASEGIMARLYRDFPNMFIEHLQKTSLMYQILDMQGSIEEIYSEASKYLNL